MGDFKKPSDLYLLKNGGEFKMGNDKFRVEKTFTGDKKCSKDKCDEKFKGDVELKDIYYQL